MSKLNALQIKTLSKPGKRHADGGGLYLAVGDGGKQSWIFRYSFAGKRREMGLGPLSLVTLAAARAMAFDCRRQVFEKIDPLEAREAKRVEAEKVAVPAMSFGECALLFIESRKPEWTCPRQAAIWESSFTNHAAPLLGMPVTEITRNDVQAVLDKIWKTKRVTASRLQNRIERVMGYATAKEFRSGDNPAAWRGNLVHIMSSKSKTTGKHFPSMPAEELPAFFPRLVAKEGFAFRALEFMILTAGRTGEVLGATWSEIDFNDAAWVISGPRMKMRRDHRVPLSSQALDLLRRLKAMSFNEYLFPSRMYGRHLSNMACLMVMRNFGLDYVPHGFRSTFKDWACEGSDILDADPLSEKALAHAEKNKTKAAYKRGDLFKKRRPLMQDWGNFCASSPKDGRD